MTTSAARVTANQQNAQRSTGPRTAEGKARSRANAVKHGLAGVGIAVPTEDASAVEERFLELQVELAPASLEASLLIRQVALNSVRLDRAALHESATISLAVRHAMTDFDLAQAAEVDRLFGTIEANPAVNRRLLMTTPAGVTRLVDALRSVRVQLASKAFESWKPEHRLKVDAYLGGMREQFPLARSQALLAALEGDFMYVDPAEVADLPDKTERIEWARDRLIDLVDAEVARLEAIHARLDTRLIDHDRSQAGNRALFQTNPEAILARKYESAALRAFHKALKDLRALRDQPIEPVAPAEVFVEIPIPNAPEASVDPEPTPPEEPNTIRPNEPNAIRPNEPNPPGSDQPGQVVPRVNPPLSPRVGLVDRGNWALMATVPGS